MAQPYLSTNLTDVHGVIIATTLGVSVRVVRVLPGLLQATGTQK